MTKPHDHPDKFQLTSCPDKFPFPTDKTHADKFPFPPDKSPFPTDKTP